MKEAWTGEIVGELHVHGISAKELALEAGLHEKYLSQLLNGRKTPKCAQKKLTDALNRLIKKSEVETKT